MPWQLSQLPSRMLYYTSISFDNELSRSVRCAVGRFAAATMRETSRRSRSSLLSSEAMRASFDRGNKARNIGVDAAIMVTATSAMPQAASATPSTANGG